MALQLNASFETPHGLVVPSSYWRWTGLGVDVPAGQGRVVLYAYASEAAFASGKQAIGQREYTLSGTDFGAFVLQAPSGDNLSEALSNAIYNYVVANDEFFASAVAV